jgi:predicted RNase H-like HicB family nuclease
MTQQYLVRASWDSEAQVWFASSDEVPGLATEAANFEVLEAKLQTMVPELLEANGVLPTRNTAERSQFTISIETIS